jgi:membrane protein YdbS with pleckstrin-like domain
MAARSDSSGETMLRRLNAHIIIALCTSCAIIAFAFDQRHDASINVPAVAFYVAAAIICLMPVVYALFRRKTCRNQTGV